jgi:hypothetical protein
MTVHDRQNDDVAKRIEELEKAYWWDQWHLTWVFLNN